MNRGSGLLGGGVINNFTAGSNSYRFSQSGPQNGMLQANLANQPGGKLGRGSMLQFNTLGPAKRDNLPRYGSNSAKGGQGLMNANTQSPYNADLGTPLPFSGKDSVILLPKKLGADRFDVCKAYETECTEAGQNAIKPFADKGLQRPNPHPSKVVNSYDAPMGTIGVDLDQQPGGGTTAQGALYTAQQIGRARDYIRQEKYDQALNCYQAARTIDSKNMNSLIGVIFCYIMSGKYQAGGLCVSHLAQDSPDFWRQEADFNAVFGVPGPDIIKRMEVVEPELNRLLNLYQAKDSKQLAEDLKLEYLSKMFLAWLRADQDGIKTSISSAAEIAPMDAPVQQLFHRITGKKKQEELKLEPLKPIG